MLNNHTYSTTTTHKHQFTTDIIATVSGGAKTGWSAGPIIAWSGKLSSMEDVMLRVEN